MEENNEKNNDIEIEGLLVDDKVKKRKSRKRKLLVSVFVLLLALGIGGNWYWENSDISSKISAVSSSAKTLGEATFVDADAEVEETTSTESEYFSSARLERQTARDSALETLQAVIDSVDESEEAHKLAAEEIANISSYIEIENKIETLVQAKGVANCLAVISEDGSRVDVIVDSEELTDELVLQIKEIATTQLNCGFENVTIIQSAS